MELIANLIGGLVLPSIVALLLFLGGVALRLTQRYARLSWWLLAASGFVTTTFSWGLVAALLMRPLEFRYATLDDPSSYPQAEYIAVLTAWAEEDPALPLTGRGNASTAYRLLQALELHQERPDCRIIVTGSDESARVMGEILLRLGVPAASLTIDGEALNTAQSAEHLAELVGNRQFFLVTSAGHMPRAMAAVQTHDLAAIPVPTDHKVRSGWRATDWGFSPDSMVKANLAMHEYAGYLWYRLIGRIT